MSRPPTTPAVPRPAHLPLALTPRFRMSSSRDRSAILPRGPRIRRSERDLETRPSTSATSPAPGSDHGTRHAALPGSVEAPRMPRGHAGLYLHNEAPRLHIFLPENCECCGRPRVRLSVRDEWHETKQKLIYKVGPRSHRDLGVTRRAPPPRRASVGVCLKLMSKENNDPG